MRLQGSYDQKEKDSISGRERKVLNYMHDI